MRIIVIKDYQATETRVWKVGQYAEVTDEKGTQMVLDGFAKECDFTYDKNGRPVEVREQPIKGEKRNHGNIKRSNNSRNRA
jgi:hypothetical protein